MGSHGEKYQIEFTRRAIMDAAEKEFFESKTTNELGQEVYNGVSEATAAALIGEGIDVGAFYNSIMEHRIPNAAGSSGFIGVDRGI